MKKIVALLVAVITCLMFTGCETKETTMRFVTGGEAGTYYAFGTVLASHAKTNAGLNIVGVVGNGSKSNVLELEDGTAQFAFCQSDVMAYAYTGTNLFDEAITCFSTVAALYTEQVQIVTCNDSITTVADLKGKKVSVGASGSGVYFNAIDVLKAYGMTLEDIEPTYQSFGDSADALKNEQIDAAFVVSGAPTPAITDLKISNKKTHLVSIEADKVNALIKMSPYYAEVTIGKEIYDFDEKYGETTTVGVGAVILCRDDVSEDNVYKFVKDILDDPASLVANHAKYAELSLKYASSITSVPYHKGAAKYFAEKDIEVATK